MIISSPQISTFVFTSGEAFHTSTLYCIPYSILYTAHGVCSIRVLCCVCVCARVCVCVCVCVVCVCVRVYVCVCVCVVCVCCVCVCCVCVLCVCVVCVCVVCVCACVCACMISINYTARGDYNSLTSDIFRSVCATAL